jgi:hypothetical protein
MELGYPGLPRMHGLESRQGLVEREDVDARLRDDDARLGQIHSETPSTALPCARASRVVDEDPPHLDGRHREEVGRTVPSHAIRAAETDVGLVHEGRRLERVSAVLVPEVRVREPTEVLVDGER